MSKEKEIWWNEIYNDDMKYVPASISDKILKSINKLIKKGEVNSADIESDIIKNIIISKKNSYEKSKKKNRENRKLVESAKVLADVLQRPNDENDGYDEGGNNINDNNFIELSSKLNSIKDIEFDLETKIKAADSRRGILAAQLEEERRGLSIVQNQLNEIMASRRIIEAKIMKEEVSIKNLRQDSINLIQKKETEILAAAKSNIKHKLLNNNKNDNSKEEIAHLSNIINNLRVELRAKSVELEELKKELQFKKNDVESRDALIDIVTNTELSRIKPVVKNINNSVNNIDNNNYGNNKIIKSTNVNKEKTSAEFILNGLKKEAMKIKNRLLNNFSYEDMLNLWIKIFLIQTATSMFVSGRPREIFSASDIESKIFSLGPCGISSLSKSFNDNEEMINNTIKYVEDNIDFGRIISELDDLYTLKESIK